VYICLFVDRENGNKTGGCLMVRGFGRTLFFVLRTLSAASAFQLMNYSRAMYPAPVCFPLVVCMCNANLSFLYVTGECHAVSATRANFSKCPFGELHSLFASPVALTPASAENDGRYVFIFRNVHLSLWMPICIYYM
jgi:hypothetical protein